MSVLAACCFVFCRVYGLKGCELKADAVLRRQRRPEHVVPSPGRCPRGLPFQARLQLILAGDAELHATRYWTVRQTPHALT